MSIAAGELIAPGGPSLPVWSFLTAISLALIGVLAQQLKARSDLKQIKAQAETATDEASKARQSASKAEANTINVSNGFVSRMDRKLDSITASQQTLIEAQRKTDHALREHLEWHLSQRRD